MDNLCNYTSRQQLGIEVFNDDQCAMIHQAILEVWITYATTQVDNN